MKKKTPKPTESEEKPVAIKRMRLFDIYPNITVDTLNGKKIENGVMFMSMHAGECTAKHNGKEVKIGIAGCLSGATVLSYKGRLAKVNLMKLIEAALDAGLADDVMNFSETK